MPFLRRTWILLLAIVFAQIPGQAGNPTLPVWSEGYFDIHHISTGKGESQFLIFPDGTTMLIDCGDMTGYGNGWAHSNPLPDASRTPAQWVARYVDTFSPTPGRIDYFLLSHFHADHMGGVPAAREGAYGYRLCGITELGEYEQIGTFVDRGYPSYDFPSAAHVERQCGMVPDYRKFIARQVEVCGAKAERFATGSRKQFRPRSGKWDFQVWNVASALMVSDGGKKLKPMYDPGQDPEQFDENMFSCVVLFRYGDFKYYSGGDLPGNPNSPGFSRDLESRIVDKVAPCQVMKADHHGHHDASNAHFLWKMAPEVIVVPAFELKHPSVDAVRRATDKLMPGRHDIYATSEVAREKLGEEWSKIKGVGHIVVRVYPGGGSWQVFVLDACSAEYPILQQSELYPTRSR